MCFFLCSLCIDLSTQFICLHAAWCACEVQYTQWTLASLEGQLLSNYYAANAAQIHILFVRLLCAWIEYKSNGSLKFCHMHWPWGTDWRPNNSGRSACNRANNRTVHCDVYAVCVCVCRRFNNFLYYISSHENDKQKTFQLFYHLMLHHSIYWNWNRNEWNRIESNGEDIERKAPKTKKYRWN